MHPPLTDNQIDGVFEEVDIDNNGTLSFEEFKAWLLGRDSVWAPPDDDEAVYAASPSKVLYESMTLDSVNPNLRSFLKSIVDEIIDEETAKPRIYRGNSMANRLKSINLTCDFAESMFYFKEFVRSSSSTMVETKLVVLPSYSLALM